MDLEQQISTLSKEMNLEELELIITKFKQSDTNDKIAVLSVQKASQLWKLRKKLHKVLCANFAQRFADLASLIPDYEVYARIAKCLSIHDKIDDEELGQLLSNQQVISLSLGLTTELGPKIENPLFQSACDLQIKASVMSKELSSIASLAVSKFAPNLCSLISPEITAMLVSFAGGLKELSETPACNIKMLGSNKVALNGFSSRSTKNYQGVLYNTDLVQETPPEFRDAVFRDLANKVALTSRIDVAKSKQDGSYGEKIRNEIKVRLDKKMNNRSPKYVRPLPIPGFEKREFRGGARKRAMKKKFGIGKELERRNKVIFGIGGQFDEDGTQYGVTALEGFRKNKASTDAAFQDKIDKKLKALDKRK